ncbi:TPA: hypothetical protein HA241_03680 [Candidatus Woesearchaeota archaeon]|nr:hypothetical protein [Candidatus Woesearchaeota archaeon]
MITFAIGILGMILIVIAFLLEEFSTYTQNTRTYNYLNIFGSAFLIYYGISLQGWPFVVLNSIWFIAAVIKLWKIFHRKKRK